MLQVYSELRMSGQGRVIERVVDKYHQVATVRMASTTGDGIHNATPMGTTDSIWR